MYDFINSAVTYMMVIDYAATNLIRWKKSYVDENRFILGLTLSIFPKIFILFYYLINFETSQAECADLFFEEQTPGFRCPQCSGPRRRYAKKVGDRVGTTLDGGDAPILIFSFGGVALTIAFGIWAVENL